MHLTNVVGYLTILFAKVELNSSGYLLIHFGKVNSHGYSPTLRRISVFACTTQVY